MMFYIIFIIKETVTFDFPWNVQQASERYSRRSRWHDVQLPTVVGQWKEAKESGAVVEPVERNDLCEPSN